MRPRCRQCQPWNLIRATLRQCGKWRFEVDMVNRRSGGSSSYRRGKTRWQPFGVQPHRVLKRPTRRFLTEPSNRASKIILRACNILVALPQRLGYVLRPGSISLRTMAWQVLCITGGYYEALTLILTPPREVSIDRFRAL